MKNKFNVATLIFYVFAALKSQKINKNMRVTNFVHNIQVSLLV